jgi:putative ABC transport system permease protein
MRTGSVGRAVRGGLRRRRVQTIVIGLVTLVSTGATALALALIVDSNTPFDDSFAAQHGADVTAVVSLQHATPAQLAASARVPSVVAAAGPFSLLTATLDASTSGPGGPGLAGVTLPQLTLAGRNTPGGPVDDLVLQAGHWATGPGQIVLASSTMQDLPSSSVVGDQFTVVSAPGKPQLTVVGVANSATGSADAWVTTGELASLGGQKAATSAQMLYRFSSAGNPAAIHDDVARLTAQLPRGAIAGTQSYLSARLAETSGISTIAPFVAAFGVIGLIMSVLIVVNVITGAVVSGYYRIGVLKSIGFTPGQVVTAYVMQALIPATVGCLAGLLLGNRLAGALLGRTAQVYQVGTLGVPAWVNLAVPIAMLGLVGIAALLPAMRAGRLSAVQAIAAGRAPRQGTGYAAHRLLGRAALPRPVTIGLAAPFARPARTAVTLLAILLGASAVTFAFGLGGSLSRVQEGLQHSSEEPVQVSLPPPGSAGPGPGGIVVRTGGHHPHGLGAGKPTGLPARLQPSAANPQRAAVAAIRAQAGTLRYVGETDRPVSVAGLTKQVQVTAFEGNARWLGYEMISGRWYTGPDQVDVPTNFLTVTGKAIGDDVTFTFGGKAVTARIVGEVFDTTNNGLAMFTDYETLAQANASLAQPSQYDIGLRPGTSPGAYAQALGNALGPAYGTNLALGGGSGKAILLALIGLLTLLLAVVAGLGVLNAVVLQTREKVHDLGVFKAIGMAPAQTVAMVVSWVAGIGLVAGVVAVPAGIALQHYVLPVMAHAAGTNLPAIVLNAYADPEIAALALAGLVIAVAGALAPAGWAATARTATALRTE